MVKTSGKKTAQNRNGSFVRLTRSSQDKVIAGVAGGIAQYLKIDPILIRLAFIILSFISGSGPIIYIILWLILPQDTSVVKTSNEVIHENAKDMQQKAEKIADDLNKDENRNRARVVVGAIIVVIGVLAFLRVFGIADFFNVNWLWPVLMIIVGLIFITKSND